MENIHLLMANRKIWVVEYFNNLKGLAAYSYLDHKPFVKNGNKRYRFF